MTRPSLLFASLMSLPVLLAQPPSGPPMPDGPGRAVVMQVCGSACHGPNVVTGAGRSRDQWTAVVNQMVARGAKASDTDLALIITYLTTHFGPGAVPAGPPRGGPPASTGRGPGPLGSGAADSHVVDAAGAERGKTLFGAECSSCHGQRARGGNEALPEAQRGTDMVRSLVVLRDRYGSLVAPFLAKGHPMRSGGDSKSLTVAQSGDIAHYLHSRVYATLRNFGELQIQNILSGDAKAGATYFSGAGKCSSCHSATGDFAGIGKRYDAVTLQQKFLFPRTVAFGRGAPPPQESKPVRVTVTLAGGQTVAGTLVSLDDFNVALRDAEGNYRSLTITPQVKVVKQDPLEVHVTLLDEISDKNIHDVVAYLESLK